MIVLGDENQIEYNNNMFKDEVYKNAKYYKSDDYVSAVNFVYNQIKIIFHNQLNLTTHFKFDTHKSIQDIRKIAEDQEELDYEDYFDLATYWDENENYLSDLIIMEGKLSYRYSKNDNGEIQNLFIEDANPNLQDEMTLMLDMKNKLDKFICSEIEYDITVNNGITI